MFSINQNKGFAMTFENGNTISVQFGSFNYCANRMNGTEYKHEMKQDETSCENAEIAIWNNAGVWYDFGNDTVKGWCSVSEVMEWANKAEKGEIQF